MPLSAQRYSAPEAAGLRSSPGFRRVHELPQPRDRLAADSSGHETDLARAKFSQARHLNWIPSVWEQSRYLRWDPSERFAGQPDPGLLGQLGGTNAGHGYLPPFLHRPRNVGVEQRGAVPAYPRAPRDTVIHVYLAHKLPQQMPCSACLRSLVCRQLVVASSEAVLYAETLTEESRITTETLRR